MDLQPPLPQPAAVLVGDAIYIYVDTHILGR
jgi:hypothetical protein